MAGLKTVTRKMSLTRVLKSRQQLKGSAQFALSGFQAFLRDGLRQFFTATQNQDDSDHLWG